jgi:predicted Zn finger-like uncharacterized protein
MPVPVECEQCQAKYLIEDRFAGKRAKCKRCGHVMAIPLPGSRARRAGSGASNDDTYDSRDAGLEPGPWGGPAGGGGGSSLPPITGVTSQPPRGWRPQDIVVERPDEISAIP